MPWTSQGVQLFRGTTVLPIGTIGLIQGLKVSGITRAEIQRSSITATHREFLGGVVDYGSVDLAMKYSVPMGALKPDPNEFAAVSYYIWMQVNATDSQTWSFNAWRQSVSMSATVDGALEGTLVLRLTGSVTIVTNIGDTSGGGSLGEG